METTNSNPKTSVALPTEVAKAPAPETLGDTPKKSPKQIIGLVTLILVPILVIALALIFWPSSGNTTDTPSDNIDESSIDWGSYNSSEITLTGESLKITSGGTYTLTGAITDGMIEVETDKDVKLILNGVTVTNSNGPALYVANADNVVVELAAGTTNTFTDSSTYSGWDEDVCAAIFSHDDLVIQGEGSLVVNGNYEDGIVGKDDLKVTGGNLTITAKDDGLRGRDSVYITGGTLEISAGGDAIRSNNSDETGKGWIKIDAGVLSLSASDDGVHAESSLEINGGTIDVKKSYEGLEAAKITVNGGAISVVSSDDGLNAAGGNDSSSPNYGNYSASSAGYELVINGGTLSVNSQGDGLDSNGPLTINGGTITVDGPTNAGNSALDAEGSVAYNGGSIVAVGASGMAVAPGTSSTGYSLSVFFTSTNAAGTVLTVKDSSGNVILEHTSAKSFQHATLSSDSFAEGKTYTLYLNGSEYATVTLSGKTTQLGSGGGMMGPGGQQGAPQNQRGTMR